MIFQVNEIRGGWLVTTWTIKDGEVKRFFPFIEKPELMTFLGECLGEKDGKQL